MHLSKCLVASPPTVGTFNKFWLQGNVEGIYLHVLRDIKMAVEDTSATQKTHKRLNDTGACVKQNSELISRKRQENGICLKQLRFRRKQSEMIGENY